MPLCVAAMGNPRRYNADMRSGYGGGGYARLWSYGSGVCTLCFALSTLFENNLLDLNAARNYCIALFLLFGVHAPVSLSIL